MLENFLGLKIKGRCFAEETELKFFPSDKQRVSMVFGRNGSGKSTVSRTFAQLAKDGTKYEGMDIVDILDRDRPEAPSALLEPAAIKDKIKVFNEDYVREKIGFEKGDAKGLSTIVLLGPQKDYDERIKEETQKRSDLDDQKTVCEKILKELIDEANPKSIRAIGKSITRTLQNQKTKSGWSYREAHIRESSKAVQVTQDVLNAIVNTSGEDDPNVNLDVFNRMVDTWEQQKSKLGLVVPPIDVGPALEYDEAPLLSVLNERIEEPVLNERDKRVIEVMNDFGRDWVNKVEEHLRETNTTYCPYCLRSFIPGDKEAVFDSIRAALDQKAKNYVARLSSLEQTMPVLSIPDLTAYRQLAPDTTRKAETLLKQLADILNKYRCDIRHRLDHVFIPPNYTSHGFAEACQALKECLNELAAKRSAHADLQRQVNELATSLHELNLRLAKKEIADDWKVLHERRVLWDDKDRKLKELDQQIAAEDKAIDELNNLKKSVKIAADRINAALKYIFLSDKRIQLEANDGVYKIKSHGFDVAPRDVSVGERNALALCYFFSDMFEGSDAKTSYRNERLIVLDDPVSSFDHENKMGVLSYIMHEIGNLTCTIKIDETHEFRPETRIICLMHELYSFLALATSINSHDKQVPDKHKMVHVLFALNNNKNELDDKFGNIESINEYRRNFQEVFDYATEENPKENIHVGNQARRLLEAFSTFVYRDGIEHLFYADVIPGSDDDAKKYRTHFKSVFSRFVVNDESHLQGRIRSLGDANNLMPFVDEGERQKAVRDAICLLYLILPQHILALFRERKPEETKKATDAALAHINSWLKDIRDKTTLTEGTAA